LKVSIVTAVYNRVDCIARAVDSVRRQSWPAVQHVIIDGASVDGTRELLQSVLTEDALFISEPDRGIYDAINKGIQRCSGEVIGLLHSDDVFASDEIVRIVAEAFEKNSDLDVLYGDVAFFDSQKPDHCIRFYSSSRFKPELLAWGWMPAHTSVFMRKRVFDRNGLYRTDYRIAGDFEYMTRIFADPALEWRYLAQVMVHMRTGGASTSGWRSALTINREILRACRENGLSTNWLKLMLRYPRKLLEFIAIR